jgi:hypothetical protein
MRIADLSLLLKKIAVGIVVTVVPLGILAGGLWLIRNVLDRTHAPAVTASQKNHP